MNSPGSSLDSSLESSELVPRIPFLPWSVARARSPDRSAPRLRASGSFIRQDVARSMKSIHRPLNRIVGAPPRGRVCSPSERDTSPQGKKVNDISYAEGKADDRSLSPFFQLPLPPLSVILSFGFTRFLESVICSAI